MNALLAEEDEQKFVEELEGRLRIPSDASVRSKIQKRINKLSEEYYERAQNILLKR